MKGLNRYKTIFLLVLTSALVACSEQQFSPSADLLSKKEVISESFLAKGDYSDKKMDVLVVVDNSFSMENEQKEMGNRIGSFINSLNGVDWQIGITTTDVSDGPHGIKGSLVPLEGASGHILSSRTPNYESVFKNTITRDETLSCDSTTYADCPSGDEQPLRAMMLAVDKKDGDNTGLFRSGADLAVIVLSDEDEMSEGHIVFPSATMPAEAESHLKESFPGKTITVFGIITPVGDEACRTKNSLPNGVYSTHVDELVDRTGGVIGSICENDYAKNLNKIGERVLQLMNHVVLSRDPDPETLDIQFDPVMNVEYTISGRKVSFNKEIPEDTKIMVVYRQLGWDFDLDEEERRQQLEDASSDDESPSSEVENSDDDDESDSVDNSTPGKDNEDH